MAFSLGPTVLLVLGVDNAGKHQANVVHHSQVVYQLCALVCVKLIERLQVLIEAFQVAQDVFHLVLIDFCRL